EVDLLDQARVERGRTSRSVQAAGCSRRSASVEQVFAESGHAFLEEGQVVVALGDAVTPPLVHVLVVERIEVDLTTLEGDHGLHLFLEPGFGDADEDAVGGKGKRSVE